MIDYKSLLDDWFEKANCKNKTLDEITKDQLIEILKAHKLYKSFPPDLGIFRVVGNKIECTNKNEVNLLNRADPYEKYFQKLIDTYDVKFRDGSHFIYDLASACPKRAIFNDIKNVCLSTHIPICDDLHVMPFSDCHWFHPNYVNYYNFSMKFSETPWREKKNQIFWRGNSYPTMKPEENLDPNKYVIEGNSQWFFQRLVMCRTYKDNPKMDFGFHEVSDADWKESWRPYRKDKVTPLAMSEYKMILNVCGTGGGCETPIWKMQSGSVMVWITDDVFYPHKKDIPLYVSWYTPVLKPWVHYVPSTVANLDETVNWCLSNEDKCLEIINNAKSVLHDILPVWDEANAYTLKKISQL